jgi:glycosyltransferase involved in cell wall biosynthesis
MRCDDHTPRNVVCLLPARNAADELPRWFESVARFADAVVALDDGSTDRTAAELQGQPLVKVLLRNPVRDGYAGWDDSANRNRLLAAAQPLAPDWIISLDHDELFPAEEGHALRRFIDVQAVDGMAYGFPRYRMIDDLEHYDRREDWAYRLFSYHPGQIFSSDRYHFMPAPTSIPIARWLTTNIRMQHLCGLTQDHRSARRQKYLEVDPEARWQDDYSYVDDPPSALHTWTPRRSAEPVIVTARYSDVPSEGEDSSFDWPVLSVVVIVDEAAVDEMVAFIRGVWEQNCVFSHELLVVARGAATADDIARLLPGVTVVAVASDRSLASCRNVGARVARGDYVVFFDAPAGLAQDALSELVKAHDEGCAVVTAEVVNGVSSAIGWTSFLDNAVHCSFARELLVRAGGFDERLGDAAVSIVRHRLLASGQREAQVRSITFTHRTELTSTRDYLSARFALGQAEATDESMRSILRRDKRRLAKIWSTRDARVRNLSVSGVLAKWAGALRGRWRVGFARRPR